MLLLVALFGCHDPDAVDTASDPCYALCYHIRETCRMDTWASKFYSCTDQDCWNQDPFPDCVADCDALTPDSRQDWVSCYADHGFTSGTDVDDCYDPISACGGGGCRPASEIDRPPECPATGY